MIDYGEKVCSFVGNATILLEALDGKTHFEQKICSKYL